MQGTLDVFILIKLSLLVTFKPKQSSSTEGEKTELDPSRVTQEDATERGLGFHRSTGWIVTETRRANRAGE